MSKTNNPNKICGQCGSEIPTNHSWVECLCGALNHVKKKSSNGRVKKTICHHIGEQASILKKDLLSQGVTIFKMTSKKD